MGTATKLDTSEAIGVSPFTSIAKYALLSDCHSAALVDRTGSIDWWCLPNFASPSVFAWLLDEDAGHFRVGVSSRARVERRYLDGSLVLRTTFQTGTGTLELDDALAMAPGVREHDLGRRSPHVLLRSARCVAGAVELEVDFSPRFEYGLTTPLIAAASEGVLATGRPATLRLSSSVPLDVEATRATARVAAILFLIVLFGCAAVSRRTRAALIPPPPPRAAPPPGRPGPAAARRVERVPDREFRRFARRELRKRMLHAVMP